MLVGILADSHDNVPMIEKAVERLNAAGCGLVLHAGDLVAPFSIAVLGKLVCPWRAVYGNNDGEKTGLKLKAASLGGSIQDPPLVVEIHGKRILVIHDCTDAQAESRNHSADVVIYGHSHVVVIEQPQGAGKPPLIINPGECGGWLTGEYTAALLDTDKMEVQLLDLSKESTDFADLTD